MCDPTLFFSESKKIDQSSRFWDRKLKFLITHSSWGFTNSPKCTRIQRLVWREPPRFWTFPNERRTHRLNFNFWRNFIVVAIIVSQYFLFHVYPWELILKSPLFRGTECAKSVSKPMYYWYQSAGNLVIDHQFCSYSSLLSLDRSVKTCWPE